MRLSLKVQDHQNPQQQQHHQHQHRNPLLLRAKVPMTVFGLPFLSGVAATDPSDLSFFLRTNFSSGPCLKLSYTPTSTTTVVTSTTTPPLTFTLKSGSSLFGSPHNSPFIISAQFTLSPQNPHPTFSLQIKPQFGDFSLRKTTYSSPNPNPNPKANGEVSSMGFVPLERPIAWKDLTVESSNKYSFLSGIAVMAKTALPVTKRVGINFQWGVNFPADMRKRLPFLTVNKIGIERVDKVKEVKEVEVKSIEGNLIDLELLKGMSLSVRSALEALQKENKEIKQNLEDMRFRKLRGQEWTYQGQSDGVVKKASPVTQNSVEFEQCKTKTTGGQNNGRNESKKNSNRASDLESELQRAIKAASS